MVFKSSLNNSAGGVSGVSSVNSETGAITIGSSGGTVIVTTPTSSTINLEVGAGAVSSVSNNDGTLVFSPAFGAVVGSLASLSSAQILIGNVSGVATARPLAGDFTLSANGTTTLATVNSNVGTFGSSVSIPVATVNAKGLITGMTTASVSASATNLSGIVPVISGGTGVATLTNHGVLLGAGTGNVASATIGTAGRLLIDQGASADPVFNPIAGDVTFTANGTSTLATVNSNVGSYGSSVSIPIATVNAKGLVTAITTASISASATNLVGIVPVISGGTGANTLTAHGVLIGEGTGVVSIATIGTIGQLLIDQGSGVDPVFKPMSGDATILGSGAIAVTKTNNVAFGTLATLNAAPAGTLTGTTIGSTVVNSSLITFGNNPTLAGTTTIANMNIGSIAYLNGGGVIQEKPYANGNSGTSFVVSLNNGNLQTITINGNVAITQGTPSNPGKYTIICTIDTTGGRTYSFAGVKFPGGTAPAYSTLSNHVDVISIVYDGTSYFGMMGIAFA